MTFQTKTNNRINGARLSEGETHPRCVTTPEPSPTARRTNRAGTGTPRDAGREPGRISWGRCERAMTGPVTGRSTATPRTFTHDASGTR